MNWLLLFKLLCGHALADFSLQTDAMAKFKNRNNKAAPPLPPWAYWLTAHALMHGGMVYLITGSLTLGLVETAIHWAADFMKCEGLTSPHADQAIHIVAKVFYAL